MKPTYIVAVSGGVDSIVMLDRLVQAHAAALIVAHVDHGIRVDSAADAVFVEQIAAHYQLPFVATRLELGAAASEVLARNERWKYLRGVKRTYAADKILTAHHADDVVETVIINLQRGTGWRGLASLRQTEEIERPLLHLRKTAIIAYAQLHGLKWREDSTNRDTTYLRNQIRHNIVPRMSDAEFATILALASRQTALRHDIEHEIERLYRPFSRYELTMWPEAIAHEMLRKHFGPMERRESARLLLFARIARAGKQLNLKSGQIIRIRGRDLIVLSAEDC